MRRILALLALLTPAVAFGQVAGKTSVTVILGSGTSISSANYTATAGSGSNAFKFTSGATLCPDASCTLNLRETSSIWTFVGGLTSDGGYASTVGSGSNAFGTGTNGARIDFGAGASDYASSNGTTVTFAGPVTTGSPLSNGTLVATGGAITGATTIAASGLFTSTVAAGSQAFVVDGYAKTGTTDANLVLGRANGTGGFLFQSSAGSTLGQFTPSGTWFNAGSAPAISSSQNVPLVVGGNATHSSGDIFIVSTNAGNSALGVFNVDFAGNVKINASGTKTRGTKALTGGTGTVTVASGALCVCSNTTSLLACQTSVTTTTLTVTSGAGTDTVAYLCL